jgi:threonine/homoserine/homoserine lactone efflux protein
MNVLEGIGMGLLLSLIIGPVFFALIQNSITKGFKYAVAMATGVILSDAVYVFISYFGVSALARSPNIEIWLGYLGGAFLIGFGIVSFFKKGMKRPNSGGLATDQPRKRIGFLKGFSLNGINPFVLLFWASIAGLVQLRDDYTTLDIWGYYLGILITVFSIDVAKAYGAHKIKRFITARLMMYLNRGVAIVLIGFGIRLIKFAMESQGYFE